MSDDDPVNPVTRVEPNPTSGSAAILVIEDCVVCGETHTHGMPDYEDRLDAGYTTDRVAHCTDGSGYIVAVTEDTKIEV